MSAGTGGGDTPPLPLGGATSGAAPQAPVPLDPDGMPVGYLFKAEYEITPREARAALSDPSRGAVLVDCRTPEEFECARVEGATLIPLQEMGQRLDDVEDLGGREILVLCHHGVRSMKATLLLRQAGFEGARSIAGGIDLWSRAVDTGVPRYDKSSGTCRVVK